MSHRAVCMRAQVWFARQFPVYRPNTLLLDNALATMGAGLPSAMAAQLVHPDRAVLAVVGDGGFMMNSQVGRLRGWASARHIFLWGCVQRSSPCTREDLLHTHEAYC